MPEDPNSIPFQQADGAGKYKAKQLPDDQADFQAQLGITGLPSDGILRDLGNISSVDWFNRILFNSIGIGTLDWQNAVLLVSGIPSLNWEAFTLNDSVGAATVNWAGASLISPSVGSETLNWDGQFLRNELGENVLNWSSSTLENSDPASPTWNMDGNILLTRDVILTFAPSNGDTIDFDDTQAPQLARINPAGGTIATLTIDLPSDGSSVNGQTVTIFCSGTVSALTITGAANIYNSPASLATGDCFIFKKVDTDAWAKIIS